jgi:hypothetical protein
VQEKIPKEEHEMIIRMEGNLISHMKENNIDGIVFDMNRCES